VSTLEVNECRIAATGRGGDWWHDYRHHFEGTGRITILMSVIPGDVVSVACDSREHAQSLMDTAVANGVHKSAFKVRA
jgi:hypothetical protein